MAKAKESNKRTETELINANLMQLVLDLERQGVNRTAIMELVAPELKVIDKGRKVTRELMEGQLKALDSCIDCIACANALCPTVPGQDDAGRKRLQRRRSTFSAMIGKVYGEWDISKQDGQLFCKHVGGATRREAITLYKVAAKLTALDLPDEFTMEDIQSALEASVDSVAADNDDKRSYGITAAQAESIAERMNGIASRIDEAKIA